MRGEVFKTQQETRRLLFLSDVVTCGKDGPALWFLYHFCLGRRRRRRWRRRGVSEVKEKLDKREEEWRERLGVGGEGRFLTVHEIDFVKVRAPGMQVSRAMGLQYNQSRALKKMHVHTHTHTHINKKKGNWICLWYLGFPVFVWLDES